MATLHMVLGRWSKTQKGKWQLDGLVDGLQVSAYVNMGFVRDCKFRSSIEPDKDYEAILVQSGDAFFVRSFLPCAVLQQQQIELSYDEKLGRELNTQKLICRVKGGLAAYVVLQDSDIAPYQADTLRQRSSFACQVEHDSLTFRVLPAPPPASKTIAAVGVAQPRNSQQGWQGMVKVNNSDYPLHVSRDRHHYRFSHLDEDNQLRYTAVWSDEYQRFDVDSIILEPDQLSGNEVKSVVFEHKRCKLRFQLDRGVEAECFISVSTVYGYRFEPCQSGWRIQVEATERGWAFKQFQVDSLWLQELTCVCTDKDEAQLAGQFSLDKIGQFTLPLSRNKTGIVVDPARLTVGTKINLPIDGTGQFLSIAKPDWRNQSFSVRFVHEVWDEQGKAYWYFSLQQSDLMLALAADEFERYGVLGMNKGVALTLRIVKGDFGYAIAELVTDPFSSCRPHDSYPAYLVKEIMPGQNKSFYEYGNVLAVILPDGFHVRALVSGALLKASRIRLGQNGLRGQFKQLLPSQAMQGYHPALAVFALFADSDVRSESGNLEQAILFCTRHEETGNGYRLHLSNEHKDRSVKKYVKTDMAKYLMPDMKAFCYDVTLQEQDGRYWLRTIHRVVKKQ